MNPRYAANKEFVPVELMARTAGLGGVTTNAGPPLNILNRECNLLGPADPVARSLRTSRLGNS